MVLRIVKVLRCELRQVNATVDIALEGKNCLLGIFSREGCGERPVTLDIQCSDITADIHEFLQLGSLDFPEFPDQQFGILQVCRPGIFFRQSGGFEILAAARPDVVVLQHAPARKDYDGFPGYPIHPLKKQVEAIELISGKPVVAITVNHEGLPVQGVPAVCRKITEEIGLPAVDVFLKDGVEQLVSVVVSRIADKKDIP